MRTQFVRELEQDAFDLLEFVDLELAHPIPEFHRGGWFDEERCARRRRVVHDSAGNRASLAPDRDDVSSVAHRYRHIGDAMMRLEPLHLSFQNSNELALRRA